MPIARISTEGLAAIALSVVALWGFVIGQRTLAERAYAERVQVLRNSPRWEVRPKTIPASAPGARRRPIRALSAG
jgi:hypothetical protein